MYQINVAFYIILNKFKFWDCCTFKNSVYVEIKPKHIIFSYLKLECISSVTFNKYKEVISFYIISGIYGKKYSKSSV